MIYQGLFFTFRDISLYIFPSREMDFGGVYFEGGDPVTVVVPYTLRLLIQSSLICVLGVPVRSAGFIRKLYLREDR